MSRFISSTRECDQCGKHTHVRYTGARWLCIRCWYEEYPVNGDAA